METKIIEFADRKHECRLLRKGDVIREGDFYKSASGKICETSDWMAGTAYSVKVHVPHYRPIFSPKKAKGKAKKVESVKPVRFWSLADRGHLAWALSFASRKTAEEHIAANPECSNYSPIRVEIRPLVTRKKGK